MLTGREPADREVVHASLKHFFEPDDVFEVRSFALEHKWDKSGGFISLPRLPTMLGAITALAHRAAGIYFTPQRLKPAVLERSPNRLTRLGEVKGEIHPRLTHDEDVIERRYFIVDVDPTKAEGFRKHSATDAEKAAAAELVTQVRAYLASRGWPAPLVVDSGNGYHLYYKLPNPFGGGKANSRTDSFAALLRALKAKFDTAGATIDQNVFNASRIMRIPGTWARKGPDTAERPHRLSAVLEVPPSWGRESADPQIDLTSDTLANLDPDGELRRLPEPKAVATETGHSAQPFSPLDAVTRARKYLAKVPAAISGEKGHNHTFTAAQAMVRGFGLSREEAIDILMSDFVPKSPPNDRWSLHEIEHKVDDAIRFPNDKEFGWLLNAPREGSRADMPDVDPDVVRELMGGLAKPRKDDDSKKLPRILVDAEESRIVDQCLKAFEADHGIFVRDFKFVIVRRDSDPLTPNSGGQLRIVSVSQDHLRTRLTNVAYLYQKKQNEKGEEVWNQIPPPNPIVSGIFAHPTKEPVRRLFAVSSSPVLRPDGSVWNEHGYDDETGVYFDSNRVTFPALGSDLGQEAANASGLRLLDLITDFPFEAEADRSVFLSMVLSTLARNLFRGPVPFHLVDANVSAAGKGLLFQVASIIAVGRELSPTGFSDELDEQRKQMLAIGRAGLPMLNFDNLESGSALGSRVLDQVLTSASISDRALGTNDLEERAVLTILCGTGNNIRVKADMGRRLIRARIVSPLDNPETRTGFKYDPLEDHVKANRPQLVTDALTMLASYLRSGRPFVKLSSLGSFGEWSRLVRSCIVWAGFPDPVETMQRVQTETDSKTEELAALIALFEYVAPNGEQITVKELASRAKGQPIMYPDASELFDATGIQAKPEELAKALGMKLRKYKDAPHAERAIRQATGMSHGGVKAWYVANLSPPAPSLLPVAEPW